MAQRVLSIPRRTFSSATTGQAVVDPKLQGAFASRNAELDRLPHLNRAVEERNALLDTQPVGKVGAEQ